jgi:acetyl-CoA carboxylase carboxyl transferase subunit alpha
MREWSTPVQTYLDFEKPLAELEAKIVELRQTAGADPNLDVGEEIDRLQAKAESQLKDLYAKLSRWQKAQVARHPLRPRFKDYVQKLVSDFQPLAGDRSFGEDRAILGGLGTIAGRSAVIVGQEKGADTKERVRHNFGMARPEGYRKAVRLMELAGRFGLPVVSFVDTPGAYPGKGAEERGQSEAIARAIDTTLGLPTPTLSIVIGEGGSGGAVAIAATDTVLMLEHSVYSVISPEGCASILWRDTARTADAAEAMRITAQDLSDLGVIESIITEPTGGAHRKPDAAIESVRQAIDRAFDEQDTLERDALRAKRREKFLRMGRTGLS